MSNQTSRSRIMAALLSVVLLLGLAPPMAFASEAPEGTIGDSAGSGVLDGLPELETALNGWNGGGAGALVATQSGDTLTVTGTVTGAQDNITLEIDQGTSVVWKADVEFVHDGSKSSLILRGRGSFELADGMIEAPSVYSSRGAMEVAGAFGVSVSITGGSLVHTGTGGNALLLGSGSVTVTGGSITSEGTGIRSSSTNDYPVIIEGGSVTSDGAAIVTPSRPVRISGGTVERTTAGPVVESNINASVFLLGGTVYSADKTGLDVVDKGLVVLWTNPSQSSYDAYDTADLQVRGSKAYWLNGSGGSGIRGDYDNVSRSFCLVPGVTVNKISQPGTPVINGGSDITRQYGDASFLLEVSGVEGIGEWDFTSSDPAVATINNSTRRVTLGTGTGAVGTTTITVKRLADYNYHDSAVSAPITLTVGKADQAAPTIEYTKSGSKDTGFIVTITSPAPANAEYSTDNFVTTEASNVITLPAGVESVDLYARLKETATHNQSQVAHLHANFMTVPVTSITVNSSADSITAKDGTLQMTVDVQPANASNKNVTWTVSGTGATINSTGLLTATANGTVTVRATAADGSGKYGEKVITISGQDTTPPTVPVTSITVNSNADSITAKDGTLQMTVDVQPANASNKNVTWTVSGTGATINSTGLLTATANGMVTVRATAADGSGKYGEKVITINGQDTTPPTVPVTSITVNSSANSITAKDGTLQMTVDVQPTNASNKNVTWTVSGTGATINSTGLLTATANGTVTVRATAADGSGKYGEKVITISGQDTTTPAAPVTSITVGSGTNSITTQGGTLQMSAGVFPDNASNKNITWTVSGSAATISSTGLLTATANGTVTVRATAADGSGVYGEKVITISGQTTTAPVTLVHSITVTGAGGASSITEKGGTLQMYADVLPANADNRLVSWTVSGYGATINSTGLLTATANGTVTVRATAADGSGVYGEKVVTISSQSGGGGGGSSSGSGSSGSSGRGSSKPDSTTTTGWIAAPAPEWVSTPNAGGKPSRSGGTAGVKAEDWQKLTGATYTHDTMDGNSVQVRVVVSNPSQWKQETMLSGYVKGQSVDSIRAFFEKWFRNSIRVIHLDQQADWEQPVSVAAKVDLTGLDTDNLVFYSYTGSNNTYRRIVTPNYYIDANGYLRFVTPWAGSIVISDGALDKR